MIETVAGGSSAEKDTLPAGIRTVLFDLDGTLMDTTDLIIDSWQHVFRYVTGRDGEIRDILGTFGEILQDSLEKVFPGRDPEELIRVFREYQNKRFENEVKLYPGTVEMLSALKGAGYRMALVTSRVRRTTARALEITGSSGFFECVVTADDCAAHKPDPEPVLMALRGMGEEPQAAVMAGDSLYDMQCARNAGASCVMVSWSSSVDAEAMKARIGTGTYQDGTADLVLERTEDLVPALERANRRRGR